MRDIYTEPSLVAAGWFDDVDVFAATHLTADGEPGRMVTGADGYLASTKFDVAFTGVGAHAGGDPEKGRNALLAAAQATLGLHAIARHSAGASRINVGTLTAGEGRNVVPRAALLRAETRGQDSDINAYMFDRAREVVAGAAAMHGAEHTLTIVGRADREDPSPELQPFVAACFEGIRGVESVVKRLEGASGSEDATAIMRRVKEHGGLATYMQIGMATQWGHHTERFDVDESALAIGVEAAARIAVGAAGFLASLPPRD